MKKIIFVVCVDRDNDLGRKAKVDGPIIGREKNLDAAVKLALADPADSDTNTIFAGIKKLAEAKKEYCNVDIVTLTGYGKSGLKSDKEINNQLDRLEKKYSVTGWILVTDGMEDAQVIPLLQSRAKIISTEEVIIKQAQVVESTFYTVKEALKDPSIARLAFGVPGITLVIVGGLLAFGQWQYSLQAVTFIIGAYLLLKGFGIEEKIVDFFRGISSSLSEQRGSVPFYLGALFIPLFGIWAGYIQLLTSEFLDISMNIASAIRVTLPFFAVAALFLGAGKAIDSIHFKKAYLLGKYIIWMVSMVLLFSIIDAGLLVFLRQANLDWFLTTIMASFIVLVVTIKISSVFDIRERITKLFVGASVVDEDGNLLGKVSNINRRIQSITFTNKNRRKTEKLRKDFSIKNGKIILGS